MGSFFVGQSVGLGCSNHEILEVMSCLVIGGDCRMIIASKSVGCNSGLGSWHAVFVWRMHGDDDGMTG